MKMLLTSAGVKNPSIHAALEDLLPKPISECNALCIPTALYGLPRVGLDLAYRFVTDTADNPMINFGWKSMGVLELTTIPSLPDDWWLPILRETDVLLVAGGDTMYLAHWIRESGLLDLLPTLNIVWVGVSAGSVVMAPRIGRNFVHWPEEGANDEGLGIVDFAIFPHLGYPGLPTHSLDHARAWIKTLDTPGYAIDDQTAIKVIDDKIEVISEGEWHYFERHAIQT